MIDNDTIGAVMRGVRGIEVTEDSLSLEAIRQVCIEGPGHFLGHDQTLSLMQADYVYPNVGDRASPKEWIEQGSTDVREKARAKVKEALSQHYPDHIPPEIDAQIREHFPVKIPREDMRPGNSRW